MDRNEYHRQWRQSNLTNRLEYERQWRKSHTNEIKTYRDKYQNQWRKANPDRVKEYTKNGYKKWYERAKVQRKLNVERYHAYNKSYRDGKRLIIFQILGNKCSNPNCLLPGGCTDIRCLQIDHVNGHGVKERKTMGGSDKMVRYYINHPDEIRDKLQLLCANCNWIKKHEKHEHPGGWKL